MKRALLTMAVVSLCTAYGDHNSPVGSVALLSAESEELQMEVQYSSLNYNVKRAVFDFNYRVRSLVDCVRYNGRPMIHDHTEEVGCPSACGYQLQSVRMSFRSVERFLYDVNWDYPRVFQAYQGVNRALYSIQSEVGGGHGGGSVSCVAVDGGWEEHFNGHVGFGRDVYEAQRNALMECQRSHGRCRIQRCN